MAVKKNKGAETNCWPSFWNENWHSPRQIIRLGFPPDSHKTNDVPTGDPQICQQTWVKTWGESSVSGVDHFSHTIIPDMISEAHWIHFRGHTPFLVQRMSVNLGRKRQDYFRLMESKDRGEEGFLLPRIPLTRCRKQGQEVSLTHTVSYSPLMYLPTPTKTVLSTGVAWKNWWVHGNWWYYQDQGQTGTIPGIVWRRSLYSRQRRGPLTAQAASAIPQRQGYACRW